MKVSCVNYNIAFGHKKQPEAPVKKQSAVKDTVKYAAGGALTAAAFTACYTAGIRGFERNFYKNTRHKIPEIIPKLKDVINKLTLKSKTGQDIAIWDINPKKSEKYFIFCGGLKNTKEDFQPAYQKFIDADFGVIGLDYQGWGQSTGEFSQKAASQSVEAVFEYLKSKGIKDNNIAVAGYSMGGGVATDFAKNKNLAAVILINTFNKMKGVIKAFDLTAEHPIQVQKHIDRIPKHFQKPLQKIPQEVLPLKFDFNTEKNLKDIKSPVFVIHSADDTVVDVKLIRELHKKFPEIKYLELKSGGHCVNDAKIDECIKFFQGLPT
jgi:pimeloyl-ACP methyl ester carboxylesterase